jgi:hypothetical protein
MREIVVALILLLGLSMTTRVAAKSGTAASVGASRTSRAARCPA